MVFAGAFGHFARANLTMGKIKKAPSPAVSGSDARQRGRKLALKFAGDELPILTRLEFQLNAQTDADFLEIDHSLKGFEWDKVAQAFALLFLQYLVWDKAGRRDTFYFSGKSRNSQAASLGDAFYKDNPFQDLFSDPNAPPKQQKLMLRIFCGENLAGKSEKLTCRYISVSEHFMPPDCIEIYWKERGTAPLTEAGEWQRLASRIRQAWRLPEESAPPIGEASPPPKSAPPEPPAKEPTTAFGMLEAQKAAEESAKPAPTASAKTRPAEPMIIRPPKPPLPSIPKHLFEIRQPPGWFWEDDDGLLNFGDVEADIWRIRDASEGVLIFGAVGSGKTSGSGSAIANAFLQAGFGGLVLTAKPDEAKRWLKLCEQTGRAGDCVHVTPGSGHKLNILEYEAQRPGERQAVTDDLIALLRCLISVMSRKGLKTARPCFLWEDEGHLFFSQHDVDFQPTARDCRAAHVILSQNLHNFLHQGHDQHAIYAVFSAMNTNIFHTNGDLETNRWASERIGRLRTERLTTSGGLLKPICAEDYTIWGRRPEDNKTMGRFQWEKRNELAIAPEDFSKLKRGGDGTCEAVILWLSHQFAINRNRNFCVKVFEQEPR